VARRFVPERGTPGIDTFLHTTRDNPSVIAGDIDD